MSQSKYGYYLRAPHRRNHPMVAIIFYVFIKSHIDFPSIYYCTSQRDAADAHRMAGIWDAKFQRQVTNGEIEGNYFGRHPDANFASNFALKFV